MRRRITHWRGPGNSSSIETSRKKANSAANGPLPASLMIWGGRPSRTGQSGCEFTIGFSQPRTHQRLYVFNHLAGRPAAPADMPLQGPHGFRLRAQQGQHDWLNRLARQISQLPTQIGKRPIALFAPLKHPGKSLMKGNQLFSTRSHLALRQSARRLPTTSWWSLRAAFEIPSSFSHGDLLYLDVAKSVILKVS